MAEAEEIIERKFSPLMRSRLLNAEHARQIHVAYVEMGIAKEAILNPEFWKMVTPSLKSEDRIEVYCEGLTFMAELMVTQVGQSAAIVKILHWHDLAEGTSKLPAKDPSNEFFVSWGNRHTGWRVQRASDKEVVSPPAGFPNEMEAMRWRDDYLKALAK